MEGLERSYYRRTPITCESSCYLLSELDDKRQLVGLDKIQEVLFGHLTIKSVAKFIKLEHINDLVTNTKNTQTKCSCRWFMNTTGFTSVTLPNQKVTSEPATQVGF